MDKRVLVEVVKPYFDIEMQRKTVPVERLEVDDERAKKLVDMGLAIVMRINKFNKQINERISKAESAKRRK